MKKYEKPRLMALSLSGSNALCACQVDAVGPNMSQEIIHALDGLVQPDQISSCFEAGYQCQIPVDVEGYCKYGPSGQTVFNS